MRGGCARAGGTDAFGCKHKRGGGARGPGRGGAGGRDRGTIRGGRAHPGTRASPAPPAEHRCYFQELFFDMVLKRSSALPGAPAEVYIVEGFILPGTRRGKAIAPLPRGDAACSRPRGRDLSLESPCFVPWSHKGKE